MTPSTTPLNLDLKKDERLRIAWQDGQISTFTISQLRSICPCAVCKLTREGADPHQLMKPPEKTTRLTILPGNYSGQLAVSSAEMVGNYALKLTFTDGHDTGIYSFAYLREMAEQSAPNQ